MVNSRAIAIMREVLDTMPQQTYRDGMGVDWGISGNRSRAMYAAALQGRTFDPKCESCDSDLYLLITTTVRSADAMAVDMKLNG